jgi:hypothetical protein
VASATGTRYKYRCTSEYLYHFDRNVFALQAAPVHETEAAFANLLAELQVVEGDLELGRQHDCDARERARLTVTRIGACTGIGEGTSRYKYMYKHK